MDIGSVREINWDYIGDAVPAFVTIIIIPLSYKCVPIFIILSLLSVLLASLTVS